MLLGLVSCCIFISCTICWLSHCVWNWSCLKEDLVADCRVADSNFYRSFSNHLSTHDLHPPLDCDIADFLFPLDIIGGNYSYVAGQVCAGYDLASVWEWNFGEELVAADCREADSNAYCHLTQQLAADCGVADSNAFCSTIAHHSTHGMHPPSDCDIADLLFPLDIIGGNYAFVAGQDCAGDKITVD